MYKYSLLCALVFTSLVVGAPTSPALGSPPPASSVDDASSPASLTPSVSSAQLVPSPASSASSAPPEFQTDTPASDFPNNPIFTPGDSTILPEAINNGLGASVIGPQNVALDQQNPDILGPPTTDAGSVQNAKWPFSLSHNRLQSGGWARQQNLDVMPIASAMAGVNMRLEPGAIRELHWHSTSEWAFVLKGTTRVTAVTTDGQNFIGDVGPGDLWYFPPGIPHSLQATGSDPDGTEFLLVFDDGSFSEDDTFLLTDWLAHVPKEVIAKNFGVDISAFNEIPKTELYIFPSEIPPQTPTAPTSPQGTTPQSFIFNLSQQNATQTPGGSIKIVDSTQFPIATTISAALVQVNPGHMRELHWHPTEDEWSYFIEGNARMTIYAASSNARTFDFQGGDVGYVPASFGHFVENIGTTPLTFLEIFKSDRVQDITLQQWLALVPPELVQAHLGVSMETIQSFNKVKQEVV